MRFALVSRVPSNPEYRIDLPNSRVEVNDLQAEVVGVNEISGLYVQMS